MSTEDHNAEEMSMKQWPQWIFAKEEDNQTEESNITNKEDQTTDLKCPKGRPEDTQTYWSCYILF